MAKIDQVNNGDSGLNSRNKINEAIKTVESDATITGAGTVASPLSAVQQDISGIATNAAEIVAIQGEQVTQDAAIALNTAKTGITTQQANDITANNAKISYTDSAVVSQNSTDITALDSGKADKATLTQSGGNVTGTIDTSANTFTLSAAGGGGGEANTASTSGTGAALTLSKFGVDLPFRGVKGIGASISTDSDSLTITAASAAQGAKADTAIQAGDLSTVATSGSYNDLSNKPTTITSQQASDITANNAKVSYNDAAQVSTNTSDISTIQGEQTTQDSAIALNTAKVSYTDAALVATHTSQISTLDSDKLDSVTTGEPTGSDVVGNAVSLTQAEYDAGTPVATTFYIIT